MANQLSIPGVQQPAVHYDGFPGGSKSRVNRAGDNVRAGKATADDLHVIDHWRAAHRSVLNTFQAILRLRTRDTQITVAQRHKRKRTIFDKLNRYPQMQLSRMDDVAGCRLIFPTVTQLYRFRSVFHRARFKHQRKNDLDKYDYMKHPKDTGYRGVHDVYAYDVKSKGGRGLTGLFVEIQYRTLVQHAWATAVEVIGYITEAQPKFQKGDHRYEDIMVLTSEMLARTYERSKGAFPEMSDEDVVQRFLALDDELSLMQTLRGLNAADRVVSENRNTILIFTGDQKLDVKTYRDAPDALRSLFELEKQLPDSDIVLVRADTGDEVRLAFKNYFSDARDFIDMVDGATAFLLKGDKPPRPKAKRKRR